MRLEERGEEAAVHLVLCQEGVQLALVNVPLVQHKGKLLAKGLNVRFYPRGALRRRRVVAEVHEGGEVAVVLRELVRFGDAVNVD